MIEGRPLSFLRVGRAEATLSAEVDPYSPEVYRKASDNLRALVQAGHLIKESSPKLYLYRLTWRGWNQVGVVGAYSVEAYRTGRIKKHEKTRAAKEDDRTRHILETKAQTGPVFLVHRPSDELAALTKEFFDASPKAVYDFEAGDGVRHEVWLLEEPARWEDALEGAGDFYIADGHHRAASAERVARELKAAGQDPAARFLAVAFPTDQVRILSYHRVVTELGEKTAADVLTEAKERFAARVMDELESGESPGEPELGRVRMYLQGVWYEMTLPESGGGESVADGLDSAVLQREFLEPVFGIADVRSDPRIDFVGGIRGVGELETWVDSGKAAVAFAMAPTALESLLEVSDVGEVMPPKSTWFEPKLRDGLLSNSWS